MDCTEDGSATNEHEEAASPAYGTEPPTAQVSAHARVRTNIRCCLGCCDHFLTLLSVEITYVFLPTHSYPGLPTVISSSSSSQHRCLTQNDVQIGSVAIAIPPRSGIRHCLLPITETIRLGTTASQDGNRRAIHNQHRALDLTDDVVQLALAQRLQRVSQERSPQAIAALQ